MTATNYCDRGDFDNLPSVQELVVDALNNNAFGRTQREIAMEIGYTKQQSVMLTMIKNGTNKVPGERIFKAADALRLPRIKMLAAYLKEQFGEDDKSWKILKGMLDRMHDDQDDLILQAIHRAQAANKTRQMIVNEETLMRLEKFVAENMMGV